MFLVHICSFGAYLFQILSYTLGLDNKENQHGIFGHGPSNILRMLNNTQVNINKQLQLIISEEKTNGKTVGTSFLI